MGGTQTNTVEIPIGDLALKGDLGLPEKALGVILFAHGSGSGRHSPRNQYVAQALRRVGLATLLLDLLTEREGVEDTLRGHLRFNIWLLADRLGIATDWLLGNSSTAKLPTGYFGASTGAGAALVAAAERPASVFAVVSRGGRPDLAKEALHNVKAPTLLIVGGNDLPVIDMNRLAMRELRVDKRLAIVPGATHLFEEPGALEEVARLAADWFLRHLHQPHHQLARGLKGLDVA